MRGGWIILRTSGPKTLPLARSLRKAGFDVWTPTQVKERRRPRSKVMAEIESPLAATFVFARARHLADLLVARDSSAGLHPSFSIFTVKSRGVPLIADTEMAGFKAAEEAANIAYRKTHHRKVEAGEIVKPSEGSFAGLTGRVSEVNGQFALVLFDGATRPIKIATWLLPESVIRTSQSQDTAARAA